MLGDMMINSPSAEYSKRSSGFALEIASSQSSSCRRLSGQRKLRENGSVQLSTFASSSESVTGDVDSAGVGSAICVIFFSSTGSLPQNQGGCRGAGQCTVPRI